MILDWESPGPGAALALEDEADVVLKLFRE